MYDGPAATTATTAAAAVLAAQAVPAVATLPSTGWNALLLVNLALLVFTTGLVLSLTRARAGVRA